MSNPKKVQYVLDHNVLRQHNQVRLIDDHKYASTSSARQVDNSEMLSDKHQKLIKISKNTPSFPTRIKQPPGSCYRYKNHVTSDFSTTVTGTSLKINLVDISYFKKLTDFINILK